MRSKPLNLSGHHLFVTGGTGFLGRTLLDYIDECAREHGTDFRVTVMTRDPQTFVHRWSRYDHMPWLRFTAGALHQFPSADKSVTDVIHAAGQSHVDMDPAAWIADTVSGARGALEWTIASGATRFVLISSGAVYGQQPPEISGFKESFQSAPDPALISSVYGQAKRIAEQLCTVYRDRYGLSTCVARCFALVSPHVPLNGKFAIGNFIRDALQSDAIVISGDGEAVRTYLYGRDAAHWILTMLLRGKGGEAYNVGSDEPISIRQLAELVAAQLAPQKSICTRAILKSDELRQLYVPDIDKAKSLGLRVETPLPEAILLSARYLSEARAL